MEILSTIELSERNKADCKRAQNLDVYRTNEYTTVYPFVFVLNTDGVGDLVMISEFICPLCGELNNLSAYHWYGDKTEQICNLCRAVITVEFDPYNETATTRARRSLGE
jgi:hypothetical protein